MGAWVLNLVLDFGDFLEENGWCVGTVTVRAFSGGPIKEVGPDCEAVERGVSSE